MDLGLKEDDWKPCEQGKLSETYPVPTPIDATKAIGRALGYVFIYTAFVFAMGVIFGVLI